MTTRPLALRGSFAATGGFPLTAVLLAAAAAVGVVAAVQPMYAAAALVAAGIALLVAAEVEALPVLLVFTMFVESVSFGPGLRVGRLAGALAVAVLVVLVLSGRKIGLRPNALLVVAGAYGFWALLSVYWADDSGLVYKTMFSYLLAVAYMATFAVLVRSRRQIGAIFVTLGFGSLIFGFVAFATSFTIDAGRAEGLQGDPNYFATYQVVALPAVLTLAAFERRPARRLVLYGVVGVIILSVVSSLSRTGLLALSAVVLASLLLPWRIFFRRPGQKVSYALAVAAAAGAAALMGSGGAYIERSQTILNPSLRNDRGSGRTDLWNAAWRAFGEEPWLGIGAGNFQAKALDLLQTTPGVNTKASYVAEGRVVHSVYLEALTELGVVGFTLYMLVLVFTARYLLVAFRRARAAGDRTLERFSVALLVSLLAFALSGVFLSNQLGKPLWIIVGLALALDVMSKRLTPLPTAVFAGGPARARGIR